MLLLYPCLLYRIYAFYSGMCEDSCDNGKKETNGVTLTTRDASSGNKIWLPGVSKLPEVKLNSEDIPLVRTYNLVMCIHIMCNTYS